MFEERGREPVPGVVALQAFDEGDGHRPRQVRVFAVALLGAAPARVATEVRVGRADDEAAAALAEFLGLKNVARLVAFDRAGLAQDVGVPRLAEAVALREGRGRHGHFPSPLARAAHGEAVYALHVVRAADAEARHVRLR